MNTQFLLQNSVWFGAALASGGMLAHSYWRERGLTEVVSTLGATQLINREDAQVLDVRSAKAFATGHLHAAKHIEIAALAERTKELDAKRPVVIVGSEGEASRALKVLKAAGLRAYALQGSVTAWQQAGLPIVKNESK